MDVSPQGVTLALTANPDVNPMETVVTPADPTLLQQPLAKVTSHVLAGDQAMEQV